MKIIFMGTPEFAVASLDAIVKAGYEIAAVITAPDKPSGRGQKVNESAVKQYAEKNGLKILQPVKLKDPDFINELKNLNADLQVVVAFRMLPEVVWNMPSKGTINLHGSLLPQYRGAAPINWAIINGETETGVTTFFLKHEIDTGDVLFSEKTVIADDETAGDIHDKLMIIGSQLLVKTIRAIESGSYQEMPQEQFASSKLRHAPKIFKEDCLVHWHNSVENVHNFIRGLSPGPTAYTVFQNKTLKIFKAEIDQNSTDLSPGELITDGKTYLKFSCEDGSISVKDIQLEGKKRMKIDEFLCGIRI
jgi:methionyl-tRNA formyltransferase